MSTGLKLAEISREIISIDSTKQHKESLGQYLTPAVLAKFAVNLFDYDDCPNIKLLDPGAGAGSLSCAFIEKFSHSSINVTAVEFDSKIIPHLAAALNTYSHINLNILNIDFIDFGLNSILSLNKYTHIILNPPYKKVKKSIFEEKSKIYSFDTHNLYSIFLELSLEIIEENGQIVAIIPRSFCNGKFFKNFRKKLLKTCSIEKIHLFLERDNIFKDDNVLQENIVIHLVKKKQSEYVSVSYCNNLSFNELEKNIICFNEIVFSGDEDHIIHIPLNTEKLDIFNFKSNFESLGVDLSTGPIVDFREIENLSNTLDNNYIPLIYPHHLKNYTFEWNGLVSKKKNCFNKNSAPNKIFYNGFYVAVRRFSSKEQTRRVHAYLIDSSKFSNINGITFENHLNIYHLKKNSLDFNVAKGLVIYLSSKLVDSYIRQFSGSTQINVSDLKYIPYPSIAKLTYLGLKWDGVSILNQKYIDDLLSEITSKG